MGQTPAHIQLAVLSRQIHQLCHRILKETGLHARGAYGADFLLIHQDTADASFSLLDIQHGAHGCKGTYSVVLTVGKDHTAVKACLSGLTGRNNLQLRRDEILLLDIIGLFQNIKNSGLHCLLSLTFPALIALIGMLFVLFSILFILLRMFFYLLRPLFLLRLSQQNGTASHDQIQSLALDDLRRFFLQLFSCQMDQQIGNKKYRIILIFTDIQFNGGSVLFHHHAVNGKRESHPLIFFHAAVIVGIQISHSAVLIERILLHVQPGAVDMRSQDIKALAYGLASHLEHHNGFVHPDAVYLVALPERMSLPDQTLQLPVAFCFNGVHNSVDALPLRLSVVQKFSVFFVHLLQLFQSLLVVGLPCVFLFHCLYS